MGGMLINQIKAVRGFCHQIRGADLANQPQQGKYAGEKTCG